LFISIKFHSHSLKGALYNYPDTLTYSTHTRTCMHASTVSVTPTVTVTVVFSLELLAVVQTQTDKLNNWVRFSF